MRRLLLPLLLALAPAAWAQPVTTAQGETKQLCRVWDGTDVMLVDGSGNIGVTGTLTCNAGSGTLAISSTQLPAALGANGALKIEGVASGTVVPISGTVTITDGAGAVNVIVDSGTIAATQSGAWNITNVSGTVSLPTGASTAAKQPALGTAGSASADVISVQGIASMTPVKVDGSGVTQPVSGTVTVTDGAGALNTIVDSGTITAVTTITNPVQLSDGADTALVSGSGSLQVTCDNCGGSTFSDDDAFTGGSSSILPIGALYDTTPPAITDGSAGIPRMNSSRALLVDGSGVTQPVSGTFWQATQPVSGTVAATQSGAWSLSANQSTNIAQLAGTATDTNSGTKSAGTLRVVIATDQPALTNKLLVTPDSVALPANQSVNVAQMNGVATTMGNGADGTGVQRVTIANNSTGIIALTTGSAQIGHLEANQSSNVAQLAGTTTDTNSGTKSAGTLRVVLATDQPALTNKLLVTPDSVALPANQSVNMAQVAGATTATGNGTASGSIRVSVASDSTGSLIATSATAANLLTRQDTSGATGAAPPARADFIGGPTSGADTTGLLAGITVCDSVAVVNISSATTTLIITGVSNRHWRICSLNLVAGAAQGVALISGTGATCGTSTAAVNGGTTGATGWQFAANGGLTQGSGIGEIMSSKVTGGATGDSMCIVTSTTGQLSGNISYAIF